MRRHIVCLSLWPGGRFLFGVTSVPFSRIPTRRPSADDWLWDCDWLSGRKDEETVERILHHQQRRGRGITADVEDDEGHRTMRNWVFTMEWGDLGERIAFSPAERRKAKQSHWGNQLEVCRDVAEERRSSKGYKFKSLFPFYSSVWESSSSPEGFRLKDKKDRWSV